MLRVSAIILTLVLAVSSASCAAEPAGPTASRNQTATGVSVASAIVSAASTEGWWQWRGPNGDGTADPSSKPPLRWSEKENVVWKIPVPGRGHSSPTIIGDRIFLTTAERGAQTQSVLAFDRSNGRPVWQKQVNQGGFPRKIHPKNSFATPTVASNGKQLFVTFAHHDKVEVVSLDLDGNILWRKPAGEFTPRRYSYGYAPSPTLYRNLVIVAADYDAKNGKGGYLTALNQQTGNVEWRTERPVGESYSSPIVARVSGRDQLLISGCDVVCSYEPLTGNQAWRARATTAATCGTMITDGKLVFASGGYPRAQTVALQDDRIVWQNNQKCYEQSMLVTGGHVYAVTDQGIACCWQASDGKEKWRGRLQGPVSASPTLANGHIYLSNERGATFVFKANPDAFELVQRNQLGNDAFASPTIVGNRLYLRVAESSGGSRREFLYCIGH